MGTEIGHHDPDIVNAAPVPLALPPSAVSVRPPLGRRERFRRWLRRRWRWVRGYVHTPQTFDLSKIAIYYYCLAILFFTLTIMLAPIPAWVHTLCFGVLALIIASALSVLVVYLQRLRTRFHGGR